VSSEDRSPIAGFAAALGAALFFAVLARAVVRGDSAAFDASVRNVIHSWATPWLTHVLRGVTELGATGFLLPLGAVIVWRLYAAGRPHAAVVFGIAALGAEACDQALKFCFRRPRPEVFFGMAQPITYSFPSGHSVASCCFYGVLAAILAAAAPSRLHQAAIWMAAACVTLAVGVSRVYLGVHYPTDVLGGYAVAIVWTALVHAGYRIWLRRQRD
jgi:undecaprenyl-diphosphatase